MSPIVNLYPDKPSRPRRWSTPDADWPSVRFQRNGHGWTAHLGRHAVLDAPSPETLAAGLYGEYGVLAVLHSDPVAA
jgi:hypothetical protein